MQSDRIGRIDILHGVIHRLLLETFKLFFMTEYLPVDQYDKDKIIKELNHRFQLNLKPSNISYPKDGFEFRESEDRVHCEIKGDNSLTRIVDMISENSNYGEIEFTGFGVYPILIFKGFLHNDFFSSGEVLAIDFDSIQINSPEKYYYQYIESREWINKRNEALKLADFKCCKCGKMEHLEVHHLNYNSLGNELQKDLLVVCRNCHKFIHSLN